MRRTVAVVMGTLTGTALLVGAKLGNASMGGGSADGTDTSAVVVSGPGSAAGPVPAGGPSGHATPTPQSTKPGTKPGTPGSTAAPGSTSRPATAAPTGTRTNTPKPTRTTAAPTPTPTGPKDGSYSASSPVNGGNQGTLSMTVTVSGGKITAISASENGGETNCYHSSCPTLTKEALAAQNASIASVSGATHTSTAYKAALSAILKSAGA